MPRSREYAQPIDYNPCLECKLCVAACPVGAIAPDGHFNFSACYTHNYREFMGGFTDWVEQVADSKDAPDYRQRVADPETASMWQSLSFGANYKAAYCMAVCPAGEDVIGPFLTDRKGFLEEVVDPLQEKAETVYVVPGSDAEEHVARRFPHKDTKRVSNGWAGQGSIRFPARPDARLPAANQRAWTPRITLRSPGGTAESDCCDSRQIGAGGRWPCRYSRPEAPCGTARHAQIPPQGVEPDMGAGHGQNPDTRVAQIAAGLRPLFSIVGDAPQKRNKRTSVKATWAQPTISGNRVFVKDVSSLALWTVN